MQQLNLMHCLTSLVQQFLSFCFQKTDMELSAIVIGAIGFIVIVHPVDF